MLPATFDACWRRWCRALVPACLGLLIPLGGCGSRTITVSVKQPIAFPHQAHLEYFSSGRHRQERIQLHLTLFGVSDPPPELVEGRCVECHPSEDLAERTACAGCHLPSQDATLRGRKDVRPCIACHRGAWNGSRATIPSRTVCVTCHNPDSQIGTAAEKQLLADLASAEDIAWVRINTTKPNVYFSHPAHVRFQAMSCTTCHADVRQLATPPTTVRVFTMTACLNCHIANRASTDCLTCHK